MLCDEQLGVTALLVSLLLFFFFNLIFFEDFKTATALRFELLPSSGARARGQK